MFLSRNSHPAVCTSYIFKCRWRNTVKQTVLLSSFFPMQKLNALVQPILKPRPVF